MVKENKRVDLTYGCEYCKGVFYDKHKAIACEQSHTAVGIGDRAKFTITLHFHDHGKPYEQHQEKEGIIVKENEDEFLIELDDGSRKWNRKADIYRRQ